MYSFFSLFLLFFIYSVFGYIVEVSKCSFTEKKLVFSRGYMIGPYIPIYGVGALTMIFLLDKYKNDLIVLFIMGTVLCSLLEYFTSLLMEKLFKLRWWDYSDDKFNINGRVCLENGVLFGLGGIIIVKVINPYIDGFIKGLPNYLIIILGIVLLLVFMIDFIESTYICFNLKNGVHRYINKDVTNELKEDVFKVIRNNGTLTMRLIKAFPNIKNITNSTLIDLNSLYSGVKKKK